MKRTGAGGTVLVEASDGQEAELEVRLAEPAWRSGASALLVPLPPHTPHQRLVSWELPPGWRSTLLRAEGRGQKAALITEAVGVGEPWRMRFGPGGGAPDPAWYRPYGNGYTTLPAALRPVVHALRAEARGERDLVERLAAWVGTRFRYDPTPSTGAFPDVSCDIRTGNCLDVNTVFLSALYALDLQASYDIGYWFEGDSRTCDGWHCWVSVIADGVHQDWDVPHHLKFGLAPLRPGLDPKPGRRFCMSRGRGNRFDVGGGVEVEVSHFCRPRWILPGGETTEAMIAAAWRDVQPSAAAREGRGTVHAELG